jgi:hypothetical protein
VTPSPHRISRLRCQVRVAGTGEAFAARAQLRRLTETRLIEEIGQAFDAAAPADVVLHVPRLELSVRVPDLDSLHAVVASSLREQVGRWRAAASTGGADGAASAPERPIEPQPAPHHACDALIAYLQTGVLPWSIAHLDRDATRALLAAAATANRGRLLMATPSSLAGAAAFVFRWLQVLQESDWLAVAHEAEAAAHPRGVVDAVAALMAPTSGLPPPARLRAAAMVLAVAAVQRTGAAVRAADLGRMPDGGIAGGESQRSPGRPFDGLPAVVRDWLNARVADVSPTTPGRVRAGEAAGPAAAAASHGQATPDGAARATQAPTPGDSAGEAPGIGVMHAGLVLMHPFLGALFERTNVVGKGEKAIPDDALPRAAALLSYAACGQDEPMAFELGFAKVLLGLQPDHDLLVPAGLLTAADKAEVDALLASVIEHWRVLKHTSVAGLRRSFLQRRGLLARVGGAWRLRVEPDAFDVLLRHLPWGIGTVVTPWMTTPLFTEWTTS